MDKAFEPDPNELGALWTKESNNEQVKRYLSGFIMINGQKQRIVVFHTKKKASEKSPDFRILKAKERDDEISVADIPF